jgi:hypothetical protein
MILIIRVKKISIVLSHSGTNAATEKVPYVTDALCPKKWLLLKKKCVERSVPM